MAKRYFNWKLLIVLVIGLIVLVVTAFGLRKWQRSRMAYGSLERGNKAYEQCLWEEAAQNLGRYLAVAQNDVPTLFKYADAQINIRPFKANHVQQSIAAYRTILRVDKSNTKAASTLVEIYLQMGMPGEAELIAKRYLETNQNPDLRRMLAMALIGQRKFDEAAVALKGIITEYPDHVSAYEILGQLTEQRRQNLPDPPEHWFNLAVKNNQSSAQAYVIRAGFYLRNKNTQAALNDLEEARKLNLSDPAVRLRLAREFMNANVPDKAEEQLVAVKNAVPTNQMLWQIWAQLAQKSQDKKKMLETAEAGLKALSSQPWDFMPAATELFIQSDHLDRAAECISKMRQKDIAPPAVAFLEGLLAENKGLDYEAVKFWYRAVQLGDESARTRLSLASALSRFGDRQSAIQQLRTLVSEQPNLVSGHLNLAILLSETGNWAEVAEQARMAIQIAPDNLDAALLYIKAQIQLLSENQTDKNSPAWNEIDSRLAAIAKASDNALPVRMVQIRLATQRSDFDKARQLLGDTKKRFPSEMEVAAAEIELLTAQNKTDEAIQKLYDAVRVFPDSVGLLRYLAITLAAKGERRECEKVLEDALVGAKKSTDKSQLGLLLSDFYSRWKEQEKCYQLLSSLVRDVPNDILLKRRLLQCEKLAKNPDQAQEVVDQIKTIEGEKGWQWRYEQAKIWFAKDNFKEQYPQIISILKENLSANPDDQASRLLLAATYERAGDLRLAIAAYDEALNRSPRDIRIIVPAVAALYKGKEYDRADEILNRAAKGNLYYPELSRLQLQSFLRRGDLSSASDILEGMSTDDPNNRSVSLSLALLKIRQKKFDEAVEILSKLKNQEPNSLPVTSVQVALDIRRGKSVEALQLCDEMVNKLRSASAYILRARTYAMLKQTDKAIEDFERAITGEPNNIEALVAESDFYRSAGRLDKAINDIQKAMSLEPNSIGVQKRAISLLLGSGNRDIVSEGKDILDKALAANPDDVELCLYKARLLLAEGTAPSIKEATNVLKAVTENRSDFGGAWVLLAEIALRQKQSAKAMDIVLQGLAHLPNDRSLLLLKARLEAAKSPTLSIPTLKALQELDPNDTDIAMTLADTYMAAGQPQQALELIKTQLSSCRGTPNERKVNIFLAAALYRNDNKEDSQKEFASLIQSDPNDPGPLLAQVRLLKEDKVWEQLNQKVADWYQNHPKDTYVPIAIAEDVAAIRSNEATKTAENILRMILEKDSGCAEAMNILATLLQNSGRSAEAAVLYQQILTIQPDNAIAINNLAWIMCEEEGKCKEALELAQRGLKVAPDYIDLIDTRGVVYYKLAQYDKAVQDFTRCVELYPEGTPSATTSYLHLGRALVKLGQKDEAVNTLRQALKLNTETGGLSAAEAAEAQHLLEELTGGGI